MSATLSFELPAFRAALKAHAVLKERDPHSMVVQHQQALLDQLNRALLLLVLIPDPGPAALEFLVAHGSAPYV